MATRNLLILTNAREFIDTKKRIDMQIFLNPSTSNLGIIQTKYEVFTNEKGVLAVTFRLKPESMNSFPDGLQMQFETILPGQARGSHYHYSDQESDNSLESFYLLKGDFDLVVCDLNKHVCEIYTAVPGVTYTVPGMIAHKAINYSDVVAEMVVQKPFNYEITNRTGKFNMDWTKDLLRHRVMIEA